MSPIVVTPDDLKPTRPVGPDAQRWQKEALEARHTSLSTVRTAADAWGKSITAILGVFAAVAFVKGPEAIKDIPTGDSAAMTVPLFGRIDPARSVVVLIFVAALLVIIATVLAAIAAQGTPGWTKILDGPRFRSKSESATRLAIKMLWASRILTLAGALSVFVALAIAWSATVEKASKPEQSSQSAIVGTANGLVCGQLTADANGQVLLKPASSAGNSFKPSGVMTLVDKCPAAP